MTKPTVPAPRDRFGGKMAPCANPLCDRWVTTTVLDPYCCGGCRKAHKGKYEIHEDGPLGHSEFCNDRCAERGTQHKRPDPKPVNLE